MSSGNDGTTTPSSVLLLLGVAAGEGVVVVVAVVATSDVGRAYDMWPVAKNISGRVTPWEQRRVVVRAILTPRQT